MLSITIDRREKVNGIVSLLKHNAEVTVKEDFLPAGDYVINESIGVERKTTSDFITSIIDRRLFNQIERLKSKYPHTILIIEGNDLYNISDMSKEAIKGAIYSLAVCWQLPVIFTEDYHETARFLVAAGRQNLQTKKNVLYRTSSKPKSKEKRQLFILQGLPGIGPSLAQKLIDKFQSIEKIFSAPEEELITIKGIGKDKAKHLKEIIRENGPVYIA